MTESTVWNDLTITHTYIHFIYTLCVLLCYASKDYVILGGTQQEGNWNTKPDPADSMSIHNGCCKLMPGLKVRTS